MPTHEKFDMTGIKTMQVARLNASGLPAGLTGSNGSNGSLTGMHFITGISGIDVNRGQPEKIDRVGNGAFSSAFLFPPGASPEGSGSGVSHDLALAAAAQNSKVVTKGIGKMIVEGGGLERYPSFCGIASGWGKSKEAGALAGLDIYWGYIIPKMQMAMWSGAMNQREGVDVNFYFALSMARAYPWGEPFTVADENREDGLLIPWAALYPLTMDVIVGDGTTGTFTLSKTPAGADDAAEQVVFAYDATNQVELVTTSEFTVDPSTPSITFLAGAIPAAGEITVVYYYYIP